MAITKYKMKKWAKMLTGRSALHVRQGEGLCYDDKTLRGYYNDLTQKVLRYPCPHGQVPQYPADNGQMREFSIGVFQYGLGCYDLYLLENNRQRLLDALACADWAVAHQQADGAWRTFDIEHAHAPYSAMAQGEGISLLCRAYVATQDERYLQAVKRAYSFMTLPLSQGGTTEYRHSSDIILYEYTHQSPVLNGWIFAFWGIYDYCLLLPQDKPAEELMVKIMRSIENHLDDFETWHWTTYNMSHSIIASPSYHQYHVAQMRVMFDLSGRKPFRDKALLWQGWARNPLYRAVAFARKAWQKAVE